MWCELVAVVTEEPFLNRRIFVHRDRCGGRGKLNEKRMKSEINARHIDHKEHVLDQDR